MTVVQAFRPGRHGGLGAWASTAAGWAAALALAAAVGSGPDARAEDRPRIEWRAGSGEAAPAKVLVLGLEPESLRRLAAQERSPDAWQRVLSVRVLQDDVLAEIGLPAMLGTHRVTGDAVEFLPKYPFMSGVRYRAVYRPPHAGPGGTPAEPISSDFGVAVGTHPGIRVVRVFPGAAVVPENLLKFYLEFSGPMSRGDAYAHLRLLDEEEGPVELPFLELAEELWNPEMTRLTVLIDPGRIKRGVRPLGEVGPAIVEGRRYRLVIDGTWPDAAGRPLASPFEKRFSVGPADREPPDPGTWTISAPAAATRGALAVAFPEPLDAALVRRCLQVVDPAGSPVTGSVSLGDDERSWSLEPESPWRAGVYQLRVVAILEDLAGNNPGKTFDVDRFERVDARVAHAVSRLAFTVK